MERLLIALAFGGLAIGLGLPGQSQQIAKSESDALALTSPSDVPAMPPAPRGKSTVFGGQIANLDPVRDRLTLRMAGQHPMTIYFDERTEAYRDGKRVRLGDLVSDLGSDRIASVETTLDGSRLFALSIHLLSHTEQYALQGRVSSYDPATGELRITSDEAPAPFKVLVDPNTQIVRIGQAKSASSSTDGAGLVTGALVAFDFTSAGSEIPKAAQIRILAVPGMAFAFRGRVSSLDVHLGRLVLVDPQNEESYLIFFSAASLPSAQTLHLNDDLRVMADYDGTHYVARGIEVDKP